MRRRTLIIGVCAILITAGIIYLLAQPAGAPPFTLLASRTIDGPDHGMDSAIGMVLDTDGTLYVTGFMTESGQGKNIWLAKFTSNLLLQKNITLDGSAHLDDAGYMLVLDGEGWLYLIGYINEIGQDNNIFLAKFNATTLSLEKNVTINCPAENGTDDGYGILFDSPGTLYIAGTLTEPDQGYNIYLAKFDLDLNLQKNITINGPVNGTDKGRFMALEGENLFVSGSMSQNNTEYDFWLGKFDLNLNLLNETIIASPTVGEDKGYGILFDETGTLYATGTVNDSIQSYNIFLAKFDSNLNQLQNTTLNGPINGEEIAYSLILHDDGNLYLTGVFSEIKGGSNVWIARFNTDLLLLKNVTIDGSNHVYDTGYGVIKGLANDIYVSGFLNETSGGVNIWLARYGVI